jgi:hypothetical protein
MMMEKKRKLSTMEVLLEATTLEKPLTFADFLFTWDAAFRMGYQTHKELQEQIGSFLKRKAMSHLGDGRFVKYAPSLPCVPFQGISELAYDAAVAECHNVHEEVRKKAIAENESIKERFPEDLKRIEKMFATDIERFKK